MKRYFIVIVCILMSCNGQKTASTKESAMESNQEASLVLLLQDEYGGFDAKETMLIKDQKRLQSLYSKINRTRKPGLPVPVIDFSKEMVIVQCNGAQRYVGSSELSFKQETNAQIILDAKITKDANTPSVTFTTHPFCIYKMSLSEKEVLVRQNFK